MIFFFRLINRLIITNCSNWKSVLCDSMTSFNRYQCELSVVRSNWVFQSIFFFLFVSLFLLNEKTQENRLKTEEISYNMFNFNCTKSQTSIGTQNAFSIYRNQVEFIHKLSMRFYRCWMIANKINEFSLQQNLRLHFSSLIWKVK